MSQKKKLDTIDYPFDVGKVPEGKEIVLSVRDLAISFKTDRGQLHAVRGVSFDLYRGETLCIVGESGSGKSVTNKTIMGILSPNAHIDSGSVTYQGEDLTKVSEEEFHRIRGTKIGMIFQDPLSSLNPIMKIGKQITETMLINGDHAKALYNSVIEEENVTLKNDERLLQIARNEKRYVLSNKKTTSPEKKQQVIQAYKDAQAKYGPLIAEDKKKLAAKKKEARKKVSEFLRALSQKHHQNEKKIFALYHSDHDKRMLYGRFVEERRRYLSEIRVTKREAKERALEVMGEVGIPEPERRFNQYPFEFSGGMRQRIVIAIALTANPEVLICDEPTTALDVTIQAQILELINKLKVARKMSVIFITHDLGVVANMADRVAVMYAGKIVEYGTASDVFYDPRHPYTWALLSSIPDVDSREKLEAIPGTPPDMVFPPKGDAFALRSKYAMGIDFEQEPPMFEINATHYAATWLLDEHAPEVLPPKIVMTRIENSLKKAKEAKGA